MRSITALVAALLVVALPAPALAGTFPVPFGNGTPMTSAGWVPNPQAGAICGYEGVGTLWLNAGTLPAHAGCFYLFNAPGNAQIVAVNVAHGFAKASAASALCTYSFAAVLGDTLRHCSGGSFSDAIATSGANWVELGIYNESNAAIALTTARANNAVYAGGWVTLSDPTPPPVWANGPTGVLGEEFLHEEVAGVQLRVSPSAFFQVNTETAERLYIHSLNAPVIGWMPR